MATHMMRKVALCCSAGASLALLLANSALAQAVAPAPAAAPAPPAASGKEATLEEIVVTSDRKNSYSADLVQAGSFRGARQLDTPLTVSVITSELLKSQQSIDLIEALKNTAGVSSNSNGPAVYNNLTIRGVVVDSRANFRLDGSLSLISSVAFPLEDKDRLEVLKGASALYYGFSNPSGIVNLTMKRPTQTPMLEATAFADSHSGGGAAVDTGDTWSGPWGTFGARVNALYAYIDTGIKDSNGHRWMGSGAFDWKPTDKLTFTVDYEGFEKRIVEPGSFRFSAAPTATAGNPYPTLGLPGLQDPTHNFGPSWAVSDGREQNILGSVNYKFTDAWNFRVDLGESYLNRFRWTPTLNPTNLLTGAGTLTVGAQQSDFTTKNARAEIDGAFYTGPLEHEVMMGFQGAQKDTHTPIAKKVNFADNFLNPVLVARPAYGPFVADLTRIDDDGIYFFDRMKVTPWLDILGGVRKSEYTESDVTTHTNTFGPDYPLSYSYGAVLKPATWASIYATYIQGLETTAAPPSTVNNPTVQLAPSTSEQKEVGVKVEPWHGLIGQIAYFDISRGSAYVNGQNFYVLDGRLDYKGVEMSLTGELTKDLSIYASALFLDAKQVSGAPSATVAGLFTPTIVGKRPEATPATSASLAGEYRLTPILPGLSITAGIYYTGNQAVNANNNAFIPSYTTVDIGAAYTRPIYGEPTTFRINATNVGNARYWESTGGLFLGENLPSTVRFSVSRKFF